MIYNDFIYVVEYLKGALRTKLKITTAVASVSFDKSFLFFFQQPDYSQQWAQYYQQQAAAQQQQAAAAAAQYQNYYAYQNAYNQAAAQAKPPQ